MSAIEMRIRDWSSVVCSSELQFGVADKVVAALPVEGRDRDPDRRADDAAAALDRIGLRQAGDDVGRHLAQFAAILDIGKDDLEFVAPKTTDHFAVADDLEQALRDLFQQRVARRMAERDRKSTRLNSSH